MSISCVAIDDEPLALKVIKSHAEKISDLNLKETFNNPVKALEYIEQQPVDLVLLDIEMPDLNGIQLAKLLNRRTKIVFTTAYSHYAVQGFDLAATDYLLKPLKFERFLEMFNRIRSQVRKPRIQQPIFIKDGLQWVKIERENLLYLQANDNYVILREKEKKTMARMTLQEAMDLLNSEKFLRVHRSYVVNTNRIDRVETHRVIIGSHEIPVSSKHRNKVLERLVQKEIDLE
jgi:two-component system, LytTR family, response regulator